MDAKITPPPDEKPGPEPKASQKNPEVSRFVRSKDQFKRFWSVINGPSPIRYLPERYRTIALTVRILFATARDMISGELSTRAMSLVYITLLALVPLLAVSFSVLKGFGVHNQVEPLLLNVLESMGPEMAREISDLVIDFVDNAQVGLLGGVGMLFLFYTVLTLMQRIEGAFNYSWHVDRGRNIAHMVSTYLTTILLGPALVFASLTMTATFASTELMESLQQTPFLGFLLEWGGRLIPYVTIVIAFTLLYVFIPNTHVRFRSALVGAAVAGVLWQISGVLFTEFFANSDRYALYAAFATLFVFMFWLYVSWLILLLGASIAFYHQNPHFTSAGHAELRMNMRARETIAIAILREIADRFYKGGAPWTAGGLAEKLATPDTAVDWTVKVLTEGKLITESGENDECLLPARAPESVLLSDVIELIRNADDTGCASTLPPPHDDQAAKLLIELAETRRMALEGRTIRSLLDAAKDS